MKHVVTDADSPIRSLLGLWKDSHLFADDARSPAKSATEPVVEAPWLKVIQEILSVGYGPKEEFRCSEGQWTWRSKRNAPSAGALYPLELVAGVVSDRSSRGNYLYVPGRGLVPYESDPLTPDDVTEMGLIKSPSHSVDAVIVLVARPWTSMRKYGLRGYLYCHLDAGHAATNMGLYTRALGGEVTVHLRFSRAAVAKRLRLTESCREPLVALSIVRDVRRSLPAPHLVHTASASTASAPSVRLEPPVAEERANWAWFSAVTSIHSRLPPPTGPVATSPLVAPRARSDQPMVRLSEAPAPVFHPADVRAAISRRSSAKGFCETSLGLGQLTALLASLKLDVPTDCGADTGLGVTVVARAVRGVEPGAWTYDHGRAALLRFGTGTHSYDFGPACMGQRLARTASALVLFHAPLSLLLERVGFAALSESHFHAAQLAQRMYLAAPAAGVGITCIGGFDGTKLASMAGLPRDEEVVYMAALGIADDRGSKEDRLSGAYSHGFDTSMSQ